MRDKRPQPFPGLRIISPTLPMTSRAAVIGALEVIPVVLISVEILDLVARTRARVPTGDFDSKFVSLCG